MNLMMSFSIKSSLPPHGNHCTTVFKGCRLLYGKSSDPHVYDWWSCHLLLYSPGSTCSCTSSTVKKYCTLYAYKVKWDVL